MHSRAAIAVSTPPIARRGPQKYEPKILHPHGFRLICTLTQPIRTDNHQGMRDELVEVQEIQQIIEQCARNDSRAQRRLYDLFAPKLFTVCLSYSRDRMDAEDTLHDGFMKIFNNIKQYKGAGPFEGWMRRIMVNTALEKYRRDQKLTVISEQIRYESAESVEHILEEIASEEIMKVVQGLTPQYRMTFLLYAVEGYNHKEIAEKLNITEGTSKSNLSRARNILQERLKEHYTEQSRERKIIPIIQ